MKEVIREYGGAVIAVVCTSLLFALVGRMLLDPNGLLAQMVQQWGNGAC